MEAGVVQYEVYFDLDGTLADFDAQVQRMFGASSADGFFDKYGPKEAWEKIIGKDADFWTTMKVLSDGKKVLDYVKQAGNPISVLSAPPKPKNAPLSYIKKVIQWKMMWAKSHVGSVPMKFAYSGEKGRFAKPNRILIDDFDKNLVEWESKGGIGIKFDNAQSVIKKLKDLGV
jgi:hypothetical protein